jgi:hypothetical protein
MARFEILGGKHYDRLGKLHRKGDIIETDADLAASYGAEKFKLLPEGWSKPKEKFKVKTKKKGALEKNGVGDPLLARGIDCTKGYKVAKDNGLEVFSRGSQYHFYAKGSVEPLNEAGLREGQVRAAIKHYLED